MVLYESKSHRWVLRCAAPWAGAGPRHSPYSCGKSLDGECHVASRVSPPGYLHHFGTPSLPERSGVEWGLLADARAGNGGVGIGEEHHHRV